MPELRSRQRRAAGALAVGLVLVACTGPSRPASYPIATHTVDSAGYVDPGGRTSDELARTELSGMRATEIGSQVITGTPASGYEFPGPSDLVSRPPIVGEGAGAGPTEDGVTASGVPVETVSPRVARARCDRERSCARVGPGARWGSDQACMDELRVWAREKVEEADCPNGLDDTQVASCLAALRDAACERPLSQLSQLSSCSPSAVCAPR